MTKGDTALANVAAYVGDSGNADEIPGPRARPHPGRPAVSRGAAFPATNAATFTFIARSHSAAPGAVILRSSA